MDSPQPTTARRPCFALRFCAEMKRLALLAVVIGLLVIAGKYYCSDRLDEEIRSHLAMATQDRIAAA